MAQAYKVGISPDEFRRCRATDINAVHRILSAEKKKKDTDAAIQQALNQLG